MNRRKFFKQLASGLLVASAPSIFVPKLIKPVWKVPVHRINPDWIDAPYEVSFWLLADMAPYRFPFYQKYLETTLSINEQTRTINIPPTDM